mgnify:CR=1 FL=1
MTEQAADIEEITGAAADIENPFARAEVEFEVADTPEIGLDPAR